MAGATSSVRSGGRQACHVIIASSAIRLQELELVKEVNGRLTDLTVNCIALDASRRSHYFMQFSDGSCVWDGPDSLTQALHEEEDLMIDQLCFAPRDGWYAPQSKPTDLL